MYDYIQLLMIHTKHSIRVRYSETDSMKYVYYGNYATYFEVARVELFRTLGMSYAAIEERGIWLPVADYKIKYLKPAFYDQELQIHTIIRSLPGVKILFEYEVYNPEGIKITEASTTLFFLDAATGKVTRCPEFLLELMKPYFENQ